MIKKIRIRLARWILGQHCPCYVMGGDRMVDFQQRGADSLISKLPDECVNHKLF